MLELGSSGSVRGVSSNGHSYRNPRPAAASVKKWRRFVGSDRGCIEEYLAVRFNIWRTR